MTDRPRNPKERTIGRLLTIVEKLRYAVDHDVHGRGVDADNAIIEARDWALKALRLCEKDALSPERHYVEGDRI